MCPCAKRCFGADRLVVDVNGTTTWVHVDEPVAVRPQFNGAAFPAWRLAACHQLPIHVTVLRPYHVSFAALSTLLVHVIALRTKHVPFDTVASLPVCVIVFRPKCVPLPPPLPHRHPASAVFVLHPTPMSKHLGHHSPIHVIFTRQATSYLSPTTTT